MVDNSVLQSSISIIKGLGKIRIGSFAKMGISVIDDLLRHYPRRYEDRANIKNIIDILDEDTCSILGTVRYPVKDRKSQRGQFITGTLIQDRTGVVDAIWFNQPYISSKILQGQSYIFFGKVKKNQSKLQIINPIIIDLKDKEKECVLVPVYPTVSSLSQYYIRQAIKQALVLAKDLADTLPESIRTIYSLEKFDFAIHNIHYPFAYQHMTQARYRLVFDELLEFQLALLAIRNQGQNMTGIQFERCSLIDRFTKKLPFELTQAQIKVFNDVYTDMTSPLVMNRLVQGDVGSGKTVIAVMAMVTAYESGYQTAMMAPTEILAQQHFNTVSKLLDGFDCKIGLLTGSTPLKRATEILTELKSGKIDIIIGTHALIEEKVEYRNLGLVVTDEQHRFGVKQRARLSEKGKNPDMLVMTATPIPRTLAMILYGDLDISVIDEMPPGRKKVKTYVVTEDMRDRIDSFIIKEVKEGRQVYIICPLVDDSDAIDASSAVKTAEDAAIKFSMFKVGIIHGKMKPLEKELIMKGFSEGAVNILVSTTVVEVGVDVPNASVMIVENAERFGLAQLHQLRGRVGRGKNQSYCILYNQSDSKISKERLEVMAGSTDGFYISEQDLKLRGPGDFFGTRQHGLPDMKISNLYTDMEILIKAQECAQYIYDNKLLETNEFSYLKEKIHDLCLKKFGGQL